MKKSEKSKVVTENEPGLNEPTTTILYRKTEVCTIDGDNITWSSLLDGFRQAHPQLLNET
jgi:hypothetical protein